MLYFSIIYRVLFFIVVVGLTASPQFYSSFLTHIMTSRFNFMLQNMYSILEFILFGSLERQG